MKIVIKVVELYEKMIYNQDLRFDFNSIKAVKYFFIFQLNWSTEKLATKLPQEIATFEPTH